MKLNFWVYVSVGLNTDVILLQISGGQLMFSRNAVAGSIIGGIATTQECIDFCAKNNIKPSIELITADKLGKVYEALLAKNDSIVRYVLDIDASM